MNTIEAMVVRSPLGWDPVLDRPRRTWAVVGTTLAVLIASVLLSYRIALPYYALAPGSAHRVDTLIEAPADRLFPPQGRFLLLTISLYKVRPVEAVVGWVRADVDVLPQDQLLPPDTTDEEYREFNVEQMDQSKETAIVVALRRLGFEVTERGNGALVQRVVAEAPAAGRLRPGDVISAIDGQPVRLFAEVGAIVTRHKPGDVLQITAAAPDGSGARTIAVPVGQDKATGRPLIGVEIRTHERAFDYPFAVDIDSGNIGGPSAGLAFALGLIDTLSPGELTGGRKVAVTGTIEIDGRVGDVGGVAQKTSAVRASGAEVFLVPPGEYEIARQHAGDALKVVKVATLQEALDALGGIGGDLSGLAAAPAPRR